MTRKFSSIILILLTVTIVFADDLADANEYFMTGQYQQAIVSYERALGSASDKAGIYYNLGVCHEKVGNLEKAVSYYKRAGNLKDAPQAAARLQDRIDQRKISRLKQDAQKAYDAMNYGVAKSKAQDILKVDPDNSWALSFISSLETETEPADTADSSQIETPETTTVITDTAVAEDSLSVSDETTQAETRVPWWLWILAPALIVIFGFLGFIMGRGSRKENAEKAIRTLIRLLPAGMVSAKKKNKLSLLFFEKGKIIKAIVEEPDGVKIGGRGVAEEMVGRNCPYDEKPEGPWSRFAELMVEVYRRAQLEKSESKHSEESSRKTHKKK